MSIATEIQRLQNAKASIKTSIENKGVVVSSSDTLDDYADYIDAINISTQEKTIKPQNQTHEITADSGYRGLSKVILDGVLVDAHDSYTTSTDSTTAYIKTVPSGALKYANLDKLGGMSYKSENLIALNDVAETTYNGITYKVQNGVIYLNGLSQTEISLYFTINEQVLNGTYYYYVEASGTTSTSLSKAFRYGTTNIVNLSDNNTINVSNKTINRLLVYIPNATTITNYVYKPMLVSGSTVPTEFKVGFTGIRDSAVTSVVSEGANLINIQEITERTRGDFKYSAKDNIFTFTTLVQNPTENNAIIQLENPITLRANQQYTSSRQTGSQANKMNFRLFYDVTNNKYYGMGTFTPTEDIIITHIQWYGKQDYGTFTYNIVLNYGSTALPYVPYIQPITKQIPSEIQALDGYGWGINDTCYNYIDFETKKFIKQTGRVFGSTYENAITIATTSAGLNCVVIQTDITFVDSDTTPLVEINNLGLTTMSASSQWTTTLKNVIAFNRSKRIIITFDQTLTEQQMIDKAKTLIVYYKLITPVETDISQYLTDDNFIEVEAGGSITANNTYNQAVPSEITYLVEV